VRQNASSFHLGSLSDRKAIAAGIVKAIKDGGGRFLRFHMNDNVWRDVDNDAAQYKAMQALRETKPSMNFLNDGILKVAFSKFIRVLVPCKTASHSRRVPSL
jgi:hypothetical protein